jgi:hypothetical protein
MYVYRLFNNDSQPAVPSSLYVANTCFWFLRVNLNLGVELYFMQYYPMHFINYYTFHYRISTIDFSTAFGPFGLHNCYCFCFRHELHNYITEMKILSCLLFLSLFLCSDAFASPQPDFLLPVDGGSVGTGFYHICAIEQKPGASVGGRAKCWGMDDDDKVMTDVPKEVCINHNLLAFVTKFD